MRAVLRHTLLLAVASAITWLLVWGPRLPEAPAQSEPERSTVALALTPRLAPASQPQPPQAGADLTYETGVSEGAQEGAPPSEARADDSEARGSTSAESEPVPEESEPVPQETETVEENEAQDAAVEETDRADESAGEDTRAESVGAAVMMSDEDLLAAARQELHERTRHGFQTVLLAAPEEQLDIARFFGEELVLVPRAALDPDAESPRWYRLDEQGAVKTVRSPPPLERYRQYRDLFDYEYGRLPQPLRSLRREVLARDEVYVFAALIPASEWALVIGRRREALARSGRPIEDVERFVVQYVRASESRYDLRVEEIQFTDGRRFRPEAAAARERSAAREPRSATQSGS